MLIKQRTFNQAIVSELIAQDINPLLARLYAARSVVSKREIDCSLNLLIPPEHLTNNTKMAVLLADAIAASKKILIIGDYDADGATATAVAFKGLASMGALVDFLVPNRFEYGYGLTPEIVLLAALQKPDILLTVDNGIASVDGVEAANRLGMQVLITDHHLPADTTPEAACIVNPNQRGCEFASKNLAGVGVMFYVLLALRAQLRERGAYIKMPEPNLSHLLDLVALGTVADLVKLDHNNRILVEQGLRRIHANAGCEGIKALLKIAGKSAKNASAQDLGFYVGPRLNAAGRLDDMRLGILCLLAETESEALTHAQTLHTLNMERRNIEADMQDSAMDSLQEITVAKDYSLSIYNADYHQGVIGILASRLKERFHRPAIVFADASDGDGANKILKGSGRSIASLHLRDALDLITKKHPQLIIKFGGHAMAAGLSIKHEDLKVFQQAFELVVRDLLSETDLQATIETDGSMQSSEMCLTNAQLILQQIWGQGFNQPLFSDKFSVINQRIVGEKHLKIVLEKDNKRFDAIYFNCTENLEPIVNAVFALDVNEYNGAKLLQLMIKHIY